MASGALADFDADGEVATGGGELRDGEFVDGGQRRDAGEDVGIGAAEGADVRAVGAGVERGIRGGAGLVGDLVTTIEGGVGRVDPRHHERVAGVGQIAPADDDGGNAVIKQVIAEGAGAGWQAEVGKEEVVVGAEGGAAGQAQAIEEIVVEIECADWGGDRQRGFGHQAVFDADAARVWAVEGDER